jgi:hypothetical protein
MSFSDRLAERIDGLAKRKIEALEHQRTVLINALRDALRATIRPKWEPNEDEKLLHPFGHPLKPFPFNQCTWCGSKWNWYRPEEEFHESRCIVQPALLVLKAADTAGIC